MFTCELLATTEENKNVKTSANQLLSRAAARFCQLALLSSKSAEEFESLVNETLREEFRVLKDLNLPYGPSAAEALIKLNVFDRLKPSSGSEI